MPLRSFFKFIIIIGLIVLGNQSVTVAQTTKKSRAQLEKEKSEVQKRLQEFDRILKQTSTRRQASMGELNAVNKKLETQTAYISTINKEVNLLNREIRETEQKIKSLHNDLKNLKEEYASMVYTSSKLNSGVTVLTFVFSSSTFKQFYMRLRYLKQYSDARKKQVEQIEKVNQQLLAQQGQLENKKEEKQVVLRKEQEQKRALDLLKKEQQSIVNSLAQKEEEIKKDIAAHKKQQEELNRLITRVIEEEIRLAEAEAKKKDSKATKSTGSSLPMTPEAAALSSNFAGNKGNIPWPVEKGFISKRYGTYPHPTLKGITETNDGVDIQTNNDEPVRAVFDGVVTKITTVPGMGGTVIIKHGEYYTMYSRLKTISVKSGESVKARSPIGTVHTNSSNGVSEVHFQTWKGLQVMDPTIWLSKK
ncbi:peptidoglycan DD-metalloendopeptidase family protein [Litoribacter alkaliphilus]|uniref:Peptidoglycan DD-metalloendopeptidase family protein n=1 Tax=Litoribacter ruber TaxID=702568 RepID=A0AAP2G0U7_9BACT|nr:peptidoglycan DD-metalloendopeptidase family protein [Litoribacter alkaliphilus]MBS9522967.1 peptidoglycan DD-metalloendopeptidase family protein [Litoribacter alkaliphilus]